MASQLTRFCVVELILVISTSTATTDHVRNDDHLYNPDDQIATAAALTSAKGDYEYFSYFVIFA